MFLLSRFAAALQEAAQVDKLIEEETGGEEVLEDRLPLLGVPLSVKESFSLQGNVPETRFPLSATLATSDWSVWVDMWYVYVPPHPAANSFFLFRHTASVCVSVSDPSDSWRVFVSQACPSPRAWCPGGGWWPPSTLRPWPCWSERAPYLWASPTPASSACGRNRTTTCTASPATRTTWRGYPEEAQVSRRCCQSESLYRPINNRY